MANKMSTSPRPVPFPSEPSSSLASLVEVTGLQGPGSLRPTVVEVDTSALAHNLREARRIVGPSVRVLAVLKADAYGHGAVPCARAFVDAGADWLGVALVGEGVELRRAGIAAPICVLSGLVENDAPALVAHGLTPMIFRGDHLEQLVSALRAAGHRRYGVHVKIDTGMGRLGVLPHDLGAFLDALASHPELEVEGLATHFARADEEEPAAIAQAAEIFRAARQTLAARGIRPGLCHLANSAALLGYPQTHGDMVRPGLMLYGLAPAPHLARCADLRPGLSLRTHVSHLKNVPAGFPVSYGGTFTTSRPSRLGVLPIGYADGLPRHLSNRGHVLAGGVRVPIVGRVCMDASLVDLTDVPGIGVYDDVVLLGRQGDGFVSADEWASLSDTISYEMLCGLGKRVPRVYR